MGYYIRFGCDALVPPLVVVITEEWVQIILFPFINQRGERLVNAVLLPKIGLWKAATEIDDKVQWLLCLFACPDYYVGDLMLPKGLKAVPKRRLKARILTEAESLKQKVSVLEDKLEKQERQLKRLMEPKRKRLRLSTQ